MLRTIVVNVDNNNNNTTNNHHKNNHHCIMSAHTYSEALKRTPNIEGPLNHMYVDGIMCGHFYDYI